MLPALTASIYVQLLLTIRVIMNKILISMLISIAPVASHAQDWACQLVNVGAYSGFKDTEAASSWIPPVMQISQDDAGLRFTYYDDVGSDKAPKTEGAVITAKDELSLKHRGAGGSLLMKATLILDTSKNTARLREILVTPGYANASVSGNYQCK